MIEVTKDKDRIAAMMVNVCGSTPALCAMLVNESGYLIASKQFEAGIMVCTFYRERGEMCCAWGWKADAHEYATRAKEITGAPFEELLAAAEGRKPPTQLAPVYTRENLSALLRQIDTATLMIKNILEIQE